MVVDGTILQATISVVAVSRHESNRFARLYFWIVLLASATVSVCANGLHAFLGESSAVHPALAATVATVAPISPVAFTHGIVELVRARVRAPASDTSRVEAVARQSARTDWEDIARALVDQEISTRLRFEDIVEVVRCSFELDMSNRTIAKRIGSNHSTVGRILEAARTVAPDGLERRAIRNE